MSRIMSAVTSPMPAARSLRHSSFKGQGRCGRPLNFAELRDSELCGASGLHFELCGAPRLWTLWSSWTLRSSSTLNFADLRDLWLSVQDFVELKDFELAPHQDFEFGGASGLRTLQGFGIFWISKSLLSSVTFNFAPHQHFELNGAPGTWTLQSFGTLRIS